MYDGEARAPNRPARGGKHWRRRTEQLVSRAVLPMCARGKGTGCGDPVCAEGDHVLTTPRNPGTGARGARHFLWLVCFACALRERTGLYSTEESAPKRLPTDVSAEARPGSAIEGSKPLLCERLTWATTLQKAAWPRIPRPETTHRPTLGSRSLTNILNVSLRCRTICGGVVL